MSFLGGPECSTGANPLAQFQKQSSADTSLQRDRLTQRPPQLNGFRNQQLPDDAQFQEFQQQGPGFNEQLPQDANYQQQLFLLEQQQQQQARAAGGDGWAGEFAQQPPTFSPEQFTQQQGRNGAFSPQDFSNFRQQQMSPASRQAQTPVPQQQSLYQRPPMYGSTFGGSGFGMQRPMMFQPQQPMYGQQPQEQYQGKGKGRIQELSDTDWEEQFKELSTVDKEGELDQLDADAEQAIEAELNQMDRYVEPLPFDLASCDPALTLHCGVGGQHGNKMVRDVGFGEFEDIWQGYQVEANVARDMLGDEGHMGEYDEWKDFDGMSHDFDGLRTFENRGPESSNYLFEENNLFDDVPNAFEEGLKIMREGGSLSLAALAFEAAVQKQPEMVEAWVALGSAQAQNEKESPAIRAMEQALKLDSNNLDALMGLSVSYTNEGYDSLAYRTLERWVSVKYPQLGLTPQGLDEAAQAEEEMGFTDRHQLHEKVTALFLEAAQLNPEGMDVDIDVQVGLGVLFYGSEDYDKAVDCFNAALDSAETGTMKREGEEHLLWNRLGATLANSGRSEEAIEAYSRALELRSNFVRARYNLGVSCINLGVLEQAAGHLLGALSMHRVIEREGRMKAAELLRDGNGNAVDDREVEGLLQQNQSTNLYDTLRRVFTQMDRRDLSEGEESESVSQPQVYAKVLRGDIVSDAETAKARWAIPNAAGGFDFADSVSPPQKSLRRLSSDNLSDLRTPRSERETEQGEPGSQLASKMDEISKLRNTVNLWYQFHAADQKPNMLKQDASPDSKRGMHTWNGEAPSSTDAPLVHGEEFSAAATVHQQTGEETSDELGALYQRVVELRQRVYASQSDEERNAAMAEFLERTGGAFKVKAMEDDVKEIVSHMEGEGSAQVAMGSDHTGRAAGKQATTNSIMSMPELATFMPPNTDLLSFQESDHRVETADQDVGEDVMPALQADPTQLPTRLQALGEKYEATTKSLKDWLSETGGSAEANAVQENDGNLQQMKDEAVRRDQENRSRLMAEWVRLTAEMSGAVDVTMTEVERSNTDMTTSLDQSTRAAQEDQHATIAENSTAKEAFVPADWRHHEHESDDLLPAETTEESDDVVRDPAVYKFVHDFEEFVYELAYDIPIAESARRVSYQRTYATCAGLERTFRHFCDEGRISNTVENRFWVLMDHRRTLWSKRYLMREVDAKEQTHEEWLHLQQEVDDLLNDMLVYITEVAKLEDLKPSAADVKSRAEEKRESGDVVGSDTAALKEKLADVDKQYIAAMQESERLKDTTDFQALLIKSLESFGEAVANTVAHSEQYQGARPRVKAMLLDALREGRVTTEVREQYNALSAANTALAQTHQTKWEAMRALREALDASKSKQDLEHWNVKFEEMKPVYAASSQALLDHTLLLENTIVPGLERQKVENPKSQVGEPSEKPEIRPSDEVMTVDISSGGEWGVDRHAAKSLQVSKTTSGLWTLEIPQGTLPLDIEDSEGSTRGFAETRAQYLAGFVYPDPGEMSRLNLAGERLTHRLLSEWYSIDVVLDNWGDRTSEATRVLEERCEELRTRYSKAKIAYDQATDYMQSLASSFNSGALEYDAQSWHDAASDVADLGLMTLDLVHEMRLNTQQWPGLITALPCGTDASILARDFANMWKMYLDTKHGDMDFLERNRMELGEGIDALANDGLITMDVHGRYLEVMDRFGQLTREVRAIADVFASEYMGEMEMDIRHMNAELQRQCREMQNELFGVLEDLDEDLKCRGTSEGLVPSWKRGKQYSGTEGAGKSKL
ncbi:Peroxisomal membrane signal receptor PTS1 [Elasticomyces elasticus]|nr:Peroxisomal membrane signal receptor PTS1 [Elasticomyces elasticus]